MSQHTLPPSLRKAARALGYADIMVGIPSYRSEATIGHVARAAQAGLVQYFPDLRPVLVNADAGAPDRTQAVVATTEPPDYIERVMLVRPTNRLERLSLTYPEVDGVAGKGAALRTIFQLADTLGIKALVVVDADLRSIMPEWIELLAGPILKGGFDFVTPLYERHKWDGTITNTITYPLTSVLYGLRIRQPIGGDFGMSGDLVRHFLAQDDWTTDVSRYGIDIWMTLTTIAGGFAVCQARLGTKVHDPKDPGSDLGPMFGQVVGTLMRVSAKQAGRWLEVRGVHDVPAYGFERFGIPPAVTVNVRQLLVQFAGGWRASRPAWQDIADGQDVAAVHRLAGTAERAVEAPTANDSRARRSIARFRFPDALWARLVYDVLLAVGRGGDPATTVEVLVPIYFARVASLVVESRRLGPDQTEALVDRQVRAFMAAKPRLVARWKTEVASRPGADDGR